MVTHPMGKASKTPSRSTLRPLFLKLPPEHIVLLKFILESYEGLGELRTTNGHTGEVVLLTVPDMLEDVERLLTELSRSIGVRQVPAPKNLENDWLLREGV